MKESTQTLFFLAAALLSVLLATQSQPDEATFEVDQLVGQSLFDGFEVDEATSMRIVSIDEETATMRDFEVAQEDGVWSLPSKGGYPADAERQMAEATAGVVDLEILAIASESAADHDAYGVVEPSEKTDVGQSGVGTRVVLTGVDGESLVDVVIGKEVKGADNQRFVRRTSQDVVFVVEVDPSKFSTKFEDWIESDLLDLQSWDVAQVRTKDYSSELITQMTQGGLRTGIAIDPRSDLTLKYDDNASEWQAVSLLKATEGSEDGDYEPFELGENEELNDEVLNDLKSAVSDLKIVDVERKPSGLSGDLKAGEDFLNDRAATRSLMTRGFAPTAGEEGAEILSTEGESHIATKDGVEYVLRFGNLQLDSAVESDAPSEEQPADGEEKKSGGVNRYLFVMARVNKDLIEKPELEIAPEDSEEEAENDATGEGESDEQAGEDEEPSESREEIEQRNKRKQDEYQQKLDDAQKRVDELNERFGDWYYVISDEVYKKVSLGRDEVITTKEPEEGEDTEQEEASDEPGPLGSTGAGIPGLPNLPGVEFDPSSAAGDSQETSGAAEAEEPGTVEETATEAAEIAEEATQSD